MFRAIFEVVVRPPLKEEVFRTLLGLIGPTSAEPGCKGCRIFMEVPQKGRLIFTSEWRSRDDLETHICSEYFRTVLSVIDLSSELPLVRIEEVRQTEGLEYLASVRGEAAC